MCCEGSECDDQQQGGWVMGSEVALNRGSAFKVSCDLNCCCEKHACVSAPGPTA